MLIATDMPSLSPPRPHRGWVGPRSYRCLAQGACAHMTEGSHQLRLPICSLGGWQQVIIPIRRIVIKLATTIKKCIHVAAFTDMCIPLPDTACLIDNFHQRVTVLM